jgi:hypothetical protein
MRNSAGNSVGGDCLSEKMTLANRVSGADVTKSVWTKEKFRVTSLQYLVVFLPLVAKFSHCTSNLVICLCYFFMKCDF